MMKLRAGALASIGFALAGLHCGGATISLGGGGNGSDGINSGSDASASSNNPNKGSGTDVGSFDPPPGIPVLSSASKVDILLAVDNSQGMGAKSELLARSLRPFLERIEAKTKDIHLGVIGSSLGNMGGDVCPPTNKATNTLAHLQRTDETGDTITLDGVLRPGGDFIGAAQRLVRGVGQQGCGLEAQLESVYRFLIQPDPWDGIRLDGF